MPRRIPSQPITPQEARHAVTAAFLQVNRYRFEFNDIDAFSFLLGLYEV
jgi:hypothetical protein